MKAKTELAPDEILVLRDVNADMTSYMGFRWPRCGSVEAPDWEPTCECGHGLHGLPWGVGGNYSIGGEHGVWLIVRVSTAPENYVHGAGDMRDKCKFGRGDVVFAGGRADAAAMISAYAPPNTPVNWAAQTAGDRSTQTAGDRSTQTAGNLSTQTAGNLSTQTAGDESTQTAGYGSTQTAGDGSTQTAGINTVQICRWFKGGAWRVASRVVTKTEANIWFRVERGVWRKCTPAEIRAAEEKTNGGRDERRPDAV